MKRIIFIISLLVAIYLNAKSQDSSAVATKDEVTEVKGAVDGINETVLEMKSTLDALKKIKISGYIQAQYQVAESAGVGSYAGGNFPQNVKSRYQVRRGRFKINYDNDLTQYVLQLDVTQSGVGIKDAYVSIKEPWYRAASLTAGVFDRPFGFEISYSSSSREAPERSRLFQTLFPGERELGAKIELAPENGPLSYFNLKAGVFNGVLSNANENDRNKDFIGRAGFQLPFDEEGLAIDGGFSVYTGTVTANSKKIYEIDNSSSIKKYIVDSTITNLGNGFDRNYYGFDLQLYYDVPVIGGATLRGEYIWGKQPGTDKSSSFYNPDAAGTTDTKSSIDGKKVTDIYMRNFNGWYLNFVQNIGLKNQFVAKYDVYTPNKDVTANDIGAVGSNLNAGDIKYSTLGLGWIYHWDSNVKFVLYYDWVKNEKVNSLASGTLAPFKEDLKDNVLTFRMQYKF
ncbi:MAG: hypothetical protein C0417_02180 [Chlorobiaceae bacterium]|nr:hypothetical protein [Chlorobiaceae bacterium]